LNEFRQMLIIRGLNVILRYSGIDALRYDCKNKKCEFRGWTIPLTQHNLLYALEKVPFCTKKAHSVIYVSGNVLAF